MVKNKFKHSEVYKTGGGVFYPFLPAAGESKGKEE